MMKLLFPIMAALLTGCAAMVLDYTPLPDQDGQRVYSIKTVYGPLDGTLDEARDVLAREAARLCRGEFRNMREQDNPRLTRWGSPNGQHDLIWEVRCKQQ